MKLRNYSPSLRNEDLLPVKSEGRTCKAFNFVDYIKAYWQTSKIYL